MIRILVQDLGKKFSRHWIFQGINFAFETGKSYAILGSNGSGKSTFLKLLSGFISPTSGKVNYVLDNESIAQEKMFEYVSAATPYTELYEDLNLLEAYNFQKRFRDMLLTRKEFVDTLELPVDRQIKDFSSGMRQKLKLALALFSKSDILLFDEPSNNLDSSAQSWFIERINEIKDDRLIIVCSNYLKTEYSFCSEFLELDKFKVQ